MNRNQILIMLLWFASHEPSVAQESRAYQNFPIVVMVQFHSIATPFRNMDLNFRNIGFGVGTEVSLNGRNNFVQQVNILWIRNRAAGDGIFAYTQTSWRPTVVDDFYAELKAGAGYMYAFRPSPSYRQTNGQWQEVGRRGKLMFTVPVGISVGQHGYLKGRHYSPFLGYQFLLLAGYNKTVPLIPETIIQVGTAIHP